MVKSNGRLSRYRLRLCKNTLGLLVAMLCLTIQQVHAVDEKPPTVTKAQLTGFATGSLLISLAVGGTINAIGNLITGQEVKNRFWFSWLGAFTGGVIGFVASAYFFRQYTGETALNYAALTLGGSTVGGITGFVLAGYADRPGRVSVALVPQRRLNSEGYSVFIDYAF